MTEDADSFVEHRKLIIVGSDISGLPSTIYAVRSNNEPLVSEGGEPGGQLTLTARVDDYPGSPEGISGPELTNNMKEQAERFSTEARHDIIEGMDASERSFMITLRNDDVYTADALTAASGVSARTLDISGKGSLMGYELSACTTCNGAFFRDGKTTVVGGGDAAVEEANFLTKFTSTVYLVHRREGFHVKDYWIDHLMEKVDEEGIELMFNTEATELYDSPEEGVDHVTLVCDPEGHPSDRLDDPETGRFGFDVGAVFYVIDHMPNAGYLDGTGVQRDDNGYIVAKGGSDGGQTATNVPGISVADDVVDYYYQQTATAGSIGVKATLDTDDYLEELEREEKQVAAGVVE